MIDLLRAKACSTRRTTYLVLDEADRMFDLGFEPQVRSLVGWVRPDRQTLLFSATMPRRIEALAAECLRDPVRISVGAVGAVNADVRQEFEVRNNEDEKGSWLAWNARRLVDEGEVIVFVNSRARCDEVTARLCGPEFSIKAAALHGELDQQSRMDVLARFRAGEVRQGGGEVTCAYDKIKCAEFIFCIDVRVSRF
jgi:ATP-dependent RNA helicase DDX42